MQFWQNIAFLRLWWWWWWCNLVKYLIQDNLKRRNKIYAANPTYLEQAYNYDNGEEEEMLKNFWRSCYDVKRGALFIISEAESKQEDWPAASSYYNYLAPTKIFHTTKVTSDSLYIKSHMIWNFEGIKYVG